MAYRIEQGCSGCGMCVEACPRDCIHDDVVPVRIDAELCVDCGVCELECPLDVVSPPLQTVRI
jgi:ferredoxin